MINTYEKYLTQADIDSFLHTNKFSSELIKEFYEYLEHYFTELDEDGEFETTEDVASSFNSVKEYFLIYQKAFHEGFSKAWCKTWAKKQTEYSPDNIFKECYEASREQNPELVDIDFQLFCKSHNDDELFIKQLKRLIENVRSSGVLPIEEEAALYSGIYKEQIAKGKSQVYADVYAAHIADGSISTEYCEAYAFAYEKAINEGKDETYTLLYADKYAHEMVNYGGGSGDKHLEYLTLKVHGEMTGWDYARKHKIEHATVFIENYQSAFLNYCFPNNPSEFLSIEDCMAKSMRKALEMHDKHLKNSFGND